MWRVVVFAAPDSAGHQPHDWRGASRAGESPPRRLAISRRQALAVGLVAAGLRGAARGQVAATIDAAPVLPDADVVSPAAPPLALAFGPLVGAGPVTGSRVWSGMVEGSPAWVTVYARGHALGDGPLWTRWGNVTSDVYALALGAPAATRLVLQFDRQRSGEVVATIWDAHATAPGAPIPFGVTADGAVSVAVPATLRVTAGASAWVDGDGLTVYDLLLETRVSPVEMEQLSDKPTRIRVGGAAGVPLWQTDALDPMPGGDDGYMRWFSAQRLRSAPAYSPGTPLHPGFPYLGVVPASGFMGADGRLPLFLDTQSGRITVSAFVGWKYGGLYQTHSVSAPPNLDFDSPWIFMRFLSHTPHPQLTVQIHNFPPGDVYNAQPPRNGRGAVAVRYSWTGESGTRWAYSLGLGGQPPFPLGHTVVGGTPLRVPPAAGIARYALRLPVEGRTFVQCMQPYDSSEGVYEYGVGWEPTPEPYVHPSLGQAQDTALLIAGERGEYQIPAVGAEPLLYTCPLDGLVHLVGAQGGVWYVAGSDLVRLLNRSGGRCLDTWVREVLPNPALAAHGIVQEVLAQVDDLILASGAARVRVYQSPTPLATGTYVPPTDGTSWWRFLSATRGYRQGRAPLDLASWPPAVATEVADLTGTLEVPTWQDDAWNAVLHLAAVRRMAKEWAGRLPDRPGDYLLRYSTHAGWTAQ